MKVGIYARESSDDTNKAPDINEQISRCKEWIVKEGHELVEVYSDNGYSGGNWQRPNWHRIIKDSRRHALQIVVTWNQDRLARDTEQFLFFYRKLKSVNVQVYSLCEGFIDMSTAGDRLKHTSLAMASESFRIITGEKVKRTFQSMKARAEAKGEKLVWGRKALDLNVDVMRRLRNEGLGYRRIAKEFNCSYQTVRRRLMTVTK